MMHKRAVLPQYYCRLELRDNDITTSWCTGLLAKVSARGSWGFEGETPPPLQRFAVELDQRFITEMAHTAALFSELFEPSGRKKLLKVSKSGFGKTCGHAATPMTFNMTLGQRFAHLHCGLPCSGCLSARGCS